jgi:uncharacterized protein YndB with AHSA1/START domain
MGTTNLVVEPGMPSLSITRDFDAPPALVFRAYTEPDLLARWMGPRRLTTEFVEWELRHGGRWRYLNREADGTAYAFRGVFHGEPAAEGIVQTWEFEGFPGSVQLQKCRFEDLGGRTRVHADVAFLSVAERDGLVASGMEEGMNEGYARLDELLLELRAAG